MNSLILIIVFLLLPSVFTVVQAASGSSGSVRGVDFRMQFVSGKLNFKSISGIKRDFDGIGSELQSSLYFMEKGPFRMNMMISSRVMTWVGKGVLEAEYDDIQTFSVAPGIEMQYGPFYIQGTSQRMNANAYYISSASKGKQFIIEGPSVAGGFNFKFGNLGIGVGVTQRSISVPGERLGLTEASQYSENSFSLNFIYYISVPPGKFFKELFSK